MIVSKITNLERLQKREKIENILDLDPFALNPKSKELYETVVKKKCSKCNKYKNLNNYVQDGFYSGTCKMCTKRINDHELVMSVLKEMKLDF